MWTGKKKKPLKSPAYVNSSIHFYSSMSHASAGLVYVHLRARLHGITSLNITIFSHLSGNLESHTISHKIEAATSSTYKLSRNASQYHITKGTTWYITKIANGADLITRKVQFLTQKHGILLTKTNHLKLFRDTVPEYSMNHVKPNNRDWTKCRF